MGTAASRVVRSSWTVMAVPRITAVARSQARTHPKSIVPQLTRGAVCRKNIVAAGIASKCEVQMAYAIGVARPVSLMVDTYGTGKYRTRKSSR